MTEETQALRVANAPVSFGVFELTVDRDDLPSGATLADLIEDTGYAGTELGPPGFFGRSGDEVHELLAGSGLALVGSFLPLRFSYKREFDDDLQRMDGTLRCSRRPPTAPSSPPCSCRTRSSSPTACATPARSSSTPRRGCRRSASASCATTPSAPPSGCATAASRWPSTTTRAPTWSRRASCRQFAERIDPDLLPLCFDSGHTAFGGGDPVAVLREFGELVGHVHLKDVDRKRMDAVYASGGGLAEAWAAGVFVPLGEGDAEVETCLAELRRLATRAGSWSSRTACCGRGSSRAPSTPSGRTARSCAERGL